MPITRQSYFLPTQITGCSLWLDAADLSSFTLSGSSVTQWNDKSGNGWNVSQATSGKRPTLVTNSLNGLPGLNFINASSQHLDTAIQSSLNSLTGLSLFYVLKPTWNIGDPVQNPAFFGIRAPGGGVTIFNYYFINDYSGTAMFNGAPITSHTGSSITSAIGKNVVSLYCSTNNNGTDIAYLNGNLTGDTITSASFGSGTNLPIIIGGDNYDPYENWQGLIYEVVFFTRVLTSIERQQVEAYLAQKWGLTGSLPATHPGLQKIIHRNLQTTLTKKQYYTAFSPRQIGGLGLWLDGADSATTTSITSGVWTDKSGGGLNTSYVAGGSGLTMGTINRIPAVTFPGGDNNAINSSAATSTANGFSIFFVASRSNSSPTGARFITNTSSSLQIYGIAPDIVSTYVNNLFSSTSLTIVTGVPFIFSLVVSPSTFSQWINGTVNSSTGTTGFAAGSTIVIGASGTSYTSPFVFAGQMGEILVFNSAITTTQRQQMESYLAQKWGLTSSLIAGHLNATFPAGSPTAIQPYVTSIKPALTGNFKLTFTGSVSSGLLSYFSFNSHLLDFKNTIILSVTGSIPYVNGQYGKAIYLANEANSANGSTATNYLTSAYNVSVPFSVSVWFNPTNTNRGSLFSSYNSTGVTAYGVNLYIQGGAISAAYNNIQNVGGSSAISVGTWYHAVITINSSNGLTLFINGSQVGSTITQTPSINGLMIGNVQDGGGSYAFSGYLDDYRIYNRVLSGGEISAIYAGTG